MIYTVMIIMVVKQSGVVSLYQQRIIISNILWLWTVSLPLLLLIH